MRWGWEGIPGKGGEGIGQNVFLWSIWLECEWGQVVGKRPQKGRVVRLWTVGGRSWLCHPLPPTLSLWGQRKTPTVREGGDHQGSTQYKRGLLVVNSCLRRIDCLHSQTSIPLRPNGADTLTGTLKGEMLQHHLGTCLRCLLLTLTPLGISILTSCPGDSDACGPWTCLQSNTSTQTPECALGTTPYFLWSSSWVEAFPLSYQAVCPLSLPGTAKQTYRTFLQVPMRSSSYFISAQSCGPKCIHSASYYGFSGAPILQKNS